MEGSASGKVCQTGEPLALSGPAWFNPAIYQVGVVEGLQSGCFLPLLSRNRLLGVLHLARLQDQAFIQDEVDFLVQVANQAAIAVENAPFRPIPCKGCCSTPERATFANCRM